MDGPSEKLDDLLGYLEENWNGIYGSRNLKSKVGAKEVLEVGQWRCREEYRRYSLPTVQRYRHELESGWSPEPAEAETAEIRSRRLESLLASKGELKSIRGGDAGEKKLCPKWAGILLRKKAPPYCKSSETYWTIVQRSYTCVQPLQTIAIL